METKYCVIMAGGIGSRFWPLSRQAMPKQFIDILGTGKSFIRSTFERFLPIIPAENFLVVTNEIYRDLVLEHLPELRADQVLCEPLRRNTAPCIAYASYRIHKACPDATIVVTPSDHLVTNEGEFQNIINQGLDFVKSGLNLLTVGIKPSRPETGYGYIQIDTTGRQGTFDKVKTFTEKPELEMAKTFVASGEFFWNSGIFIWSAKGIVAAFDEHLPEMASQFAAGQAHYGTPSEQQFINDLYNDCESISIDYGVMEKAEQVFVRQADFGWSDIGTWGSLYAHVPKDENDNAVKVGRTILNDTRNCVINLSSDKVAVIEGLDGYLVVETPANLLICRIENEQQIRNFVEDIKYQYGDEYV